MRKPNKFERHESRLATTDEQGHRVFLYPEDVKGKWRNKRTIFFWFLILLYLVLPWIHIGGKQSILLNIAKREFTFFTHTFYSHDAPLLIFIFLGIPLFFAFVTSIWGRAWCGWGCPQTVFIDAIYRQIELWTEGKSRQREALDKAPMSLLKAAKKLSKWILYLLVSMHIAHSFIGYFVGTWELYEITLAPPSSNFGIFTATWITVAIILIDFGWFREQFCIIACPYGRMQSVIMDDHSMVVTYDEKRGEPRRLSEESNSESPVLEGDCINCYHCVKVCPTGIDIRRGTQLECIACTNCIDACDEIMTKVGKPEGLIRYDTELGKQGVKVKKIGLRSIIYLTLMTIVFGGFIYMLNQQDRLRVMMLRGSKSPFQIVRTTEIEEIANHYKIAIDYNGEKVQKLFFMIKDPVLAKAIRVATPRAPWQLKKGHNKANIFFRFNKKILIKGNRKIILLIKNGDTEKEATLVLEQEVNLAGPLR
ncbi:MAG: cytochrome c oxidase accessory protein CcoG [Bacteriovoracaceae bacterium]|nr:cytochrome c oxidase accessory protein CcoG [Bacteriovoracaceae bacterium]